MLTQHDSKCGYCPHYNQYDVASVNIVSHFFAAGFRAMLLVSTTGL
jgi:hypothetical protein